VPGTPSGIQAGAAVLLNWGASTDNFGVTGYDVFRATGATGGTFASVGTATTNQFTDSTVTLGQTYRYQVRARDLAGNLSAFSSTVTVTTSTCTQPPPPPTNLTA
jgi:chitodextrinase